MARNLEEIKKDIEALPSEERIHLYDWLYGLDPQADEKSIEQSWYPVLEQRMKDYKSGKISSVSGDQVFQEIKEKFGFEV